MLWKGPNLLKIVAAAYGVSDVEMSEIIEATCKSPGYNPQDESIQRVREVILEICPQQRDSYETQVELNNIQFRLRKIEQEATKGEAED